MSFAPERKTMRFIHTGDLHLGMQPDKKQPWSEARARELWDSFADVIHICGRDHIDLLLIAGDLFHRQPAAGEVKELYSLFASIPDTRIVFIAGNHDYLTASSVLRTGKRPSNVTFLAGESPESVYFADINTEVYGLSFHHRELREPLLDGLRPLHPDRINILLAHGGEASSLPVNTGLLDRSGFDYIAFGHLHKPQDISDHYRYCGSLEPLDKNETGEHGYIFGELTEDPASGLHRLSSSRIFHALRSYIHEELTVDLQTTNMLLQERIKDLILARGRNNIYVITLSGFRDPDLSFDTESLAALGNICEIIDNTCPAYDFEALRRDNRDNIIGMYIDAVSAREDDPELKNKALYYGVAALLKQL